MNAIIQFLVVLLRMLLPALFREARDTCEDAARQPELKQRLRERVQRTWERTALVAFALLILPGCFTRTIYVPHGEPVRLRQTIKNAEVWVMGADGKPVAGKMNLPEGWYCLDMPPEE